MKSLIANIENVFFLGIGGIGMSALARWFNAAGKTVHGFDKTATPLTKALEAEGIGVFYEDSTGFLPEAFRAFNATSLVIFTPALPKNDEVSSKVESSGYNLFLHLKSLGYRPYKRAEVLGMIGEGAFALAIAGTHGKTTTSSMIAHLLKHSGRDCAAFLGGIMQNYDSNVIFSEKFDKDTLVVVEADEFDRSFLTLYPNLAVVTSADPDHLDIYGDGNAMRQSFSDFISQIKPGGKLFLKEGLQKVLEIKQGLDCVTYGINAGKIQASALRFAEGCFLFDYAGEKVNMDGLALAMPGIHNVENATAAVSLALEIGLSEAEIRAGLLSYKGVKRRFEKIWEHEGKVYIDDYAHHPGEIEPLLQSVRMMYPGKKITAVFQPHLFSRTNDFQEGFAASLSLADKAILLDIYPAREVPMQGVDSGIIYDKLTAPEKAWIKDGELLEYLKQDVSEILLTVGAGNIDRFVLPIRAMLQQKAEGKAI